MVPDPLTARLPPVPITIAAVVFVPLVRAENAADPPLPHAIPVPENTPELFAWTHWVSPVIPESVIDAAAREVIVPRDVNELVTIAAGSAVPVSPEAGIAVAVTAPDPVGPKEHPVPQSIAAVVFVAPVMAENAVAAVLEAVIVTAPVPPTGDSVIFVPAMSCETPPAPPPLDWP
jgi:hypothetical protein